MPEPVRTLGYDTLTRLLAPRERNSHKGDFGHVLVVGGDHGTGGAVLMAAEAAARSGAGLVSVATRAAHVPALLQRRPELMVHAVNCSADLQACAGRATAIVAGPGLGQSDWSRECLQEILDLAASKSLPLVLDADALNLLSRDKALCDRYPEPKWILTPHTGEAARLLGISRDEVDAGRDQAVIRLQAEYGGVAVLKGAGTLLCYRRNGRLQVLRCVHGNPGMASGGMGDVLSGVLGALLAQHHSLGDSARIGVSVHSKAADLAAARDGERGLLATDLLPYVRRLLNP